MSEIPLAAPRFRCWVLWTPPAPAASSKRCLNKSNAQKEIFSFQNLLIRRIAQRFPGFGHCCPGTGKSQHKSGGIQYVCNSILSPPRRLFLFYSPAIKSKQLWSLLPLLCFLGLIFLSLEGNHFQGIQIAAVKPGGLSQERTPGHFCSHLSIQELLRASPSSREGRKKPAGW